MDVYLWIETRCVGGPIDGHTVWTDVEFDEYRFLLPDDRDRPMMALAREPPVVSRPGRRVAVYRRDLPRRPDVLVFDRVKRG
jgi:hypothetical protein